MALPYENATSGERAMAEVQKILQRFGCQSFGSMMDFENKTLIVQFQHRGIQISVKASAHGYAAAWLKEHPWSSRSKRNRTEHEQEAMHRASIAVYSILRDWIKGQVMAIEAGILSFEGAFLGQVLLGNGQSVLDYMNEKKMLPAPEGK